MLPLLPRWTMMQGQERYEAARFAAVVKPKLSEIGVADYFLLREELASIQPKTNLSNRMMILSSGPGILNYADRS